MSNQQTQPDALTTEEAAAIAETNEAYQFRTLIDGLPPEICAEYGASWHEVGGATAPVFEKLPTSGLNHVIGLGVHQPASESMIDELISLYNRKRITFIVTVSPAAQPAQLTEWLLERGFRHSSNHAKVIRGTERPPEIETEFHIAQVDESTAAQYAAVVQAGFQNPAWTVSLFEHMARVPNVYSYIAYAGDVPAGVGSLLVSGEWGALFNDTTLPEYRRRGAQGAIMSRRIRDGIALGCRWFTSETAEDTPEAPNSSYRNMIRTGFQRAYIRPNYQYDF